MMKCAKVRLSPQVQAQLKGLVEENPVPAGKRSFKRLNAVWAELLRLGFSESQCQAALGIQHVHDLTSALDWMSVFLPNEELPQRVRAIFFLSLLIIRAAVCCRGEFG